MQSLRALFFLAGLIVFAFPAFAASDDAAKDNQPAPTDNIKKESSPQQQLVETVDIQGNRRLRDEDLLFYIKTRPGDTFDPAQLERDLKELLSLNFFDKAESKVLTEPGVRGGVNVIFVVKELPIIRSLDFEGLKAVPESDVLKAFRENRVGISVESVYDPVKARNGSRVIRELLASKGYPNATGTVNPLTKRFRQPRFRRHLIKLIRVIVRASWTSNSRVTSISRTANCESQLKLVQETGLIYTLHRH